PYDILFLIQARKNPNIYQFPSPIVQEFLLFTVSNPNITKTLPSISHISHARTLSLLSLSRFSSSSSSSITVTTIDHRPIATNSSPSPPLPSRAAT
ncbi:Unknown protein, partial [Striga hermonthica]